MTGNRMGATKKMLYTNGVDRSLPDTNPAECLPALKNLVIFWVVVLYGTLRVTHRFLQYGFT